MKELLKLKEVFKLIPIYIQVIVVAFIIFMIITSYLQYTRTVDLKAEVKSLKKDNIELKKKRDLIYEDIEKLSIQNTKLKSNIQKVTEERNLFNLKYNQTNEKLKKTIVNYNNATDSTKDSLFTNAINN